MARRWQSEGESTHLHADRSRQDHRLGGQVEDGGERQQDESNDYCEFNTRSEVGSQTECRISAHKAGTEIPISGDYGSLGPQIQRTGGDNHNQMQTEKSSSKVYEDQELGQLAGNTEDDLPCILQDSTGIQCTSLAPVDI